MYIPLPPVGYWQCVAKDQVHHVWYRSAPSRPLAYLAVKQACQRNSSSCKVYRIACRYNPVKAFGRGCKVIDGRGGVWQASPGFNPCAQALQQCQQSHRLRRINLSQCRVAPAE